MRKMVVDTSEESRAVWLYDQSVPLAERAEKKLHFPNMMAAGNFLGVDPRHVWQRMSNKEKCTSKRDGKKYAIKPASTNLEKLTPMEQQFRITVPEGKTVEELFQQSVKIMERIRHWSSIKTREAELKTKMWMDHRDEFLASLNIRSVSIEQ